ncbi:family 43 glycosylhydrolase [Niabella pedocola]|uniref:Family 43 glycosylhydrolase n=1 Tax=Niabella pedocola TaxID=1752077 RepID=A0ABS8PV46_9BACT|nr:family 43 glycosylhydrolase [Niabella pedocola]MCD2424944.1 family 43 glycosylhydrolase [Niabella pedocola]
MKTTTLGILLLGLLLTACKQSMKDTELTAARAANRQSTLAALASVYQNPVIPTAQDPKDPQVFKAADGKFYLVHPNDNKYKIYSSPDLVNWTLKTASGFSKATGSFWSAGSFKYGSTYNLYYTYVQGANNKRIGVATSTTPEGPYTDANANLVVKTDAGGGYIPVIDPSVFKDPANGKVYLYYARNVGTGTLPDLRCVELTADGLNTVAGTDKQVLTITQDWEKINIEHPLVYYAPNAQASHRYYMLYNGAGGALPRYAIGYAYAASPTGPFTKAVAGTSTGNNPLVAQDPAKGIYGPGAPNTVVDDAGERWLIYRIKTTNTEAWNDRAICIDVLFRNTADQLICTPTKGTNQTAPTF